MFASRRVVIQNLLAVVGGTVWAAASSLFLTTVVARAAGIAPPLVLMLANRSVTSPFALAGAGFLCARPRRPHCPRAAVR